MKYVLDTHTWIWWHVAPHHLPPSVIKCIKNINTDGNLILSQLSVWEFCKLLEKKRIGISCDPEEWINKALAMTHLTLMPLTPHIAYKSTTLPQPFHNDPADQIIVATARKEGATILTKDARMHTYPHVKTLWN